MQREGHFTNWKKRNGFCLKTKGVLPKVYEIFGSELPLDATLKLEWGRAKFSALTWDNRHPEESPKPLTKIILFSRRKSIKIRKDPYIVTKSHTLFQRVKFS